MDLKEILDSNRQELLDLTTRNRLLSIPVNVQSARIVTIQDELSSRVFQFLVPEKKTLSFLPGRPSKKASASVLVSGAEAEEESGLPQPDDEKDPATGLPRRYNDARLQTVLTPEALQSRLFNLYYDSRTMMEEQGVNILYLALGQLKWLDTDEKNSDTPHYAPLILVPVQLERKTASERFYIQWNEEDLEENLSLRAKLKQDFNIILPDFPVVEDLDVLKYFDAVRQTISVAAGWEVLPDAITLGFFSFAKFLMYRDLDPANWPKEEMLLAHPFIAGLLQDGFPRQEPLFPADIYVDDIIPAAKLDQVVDADSSQTLAIEAVRQGRSLVVQGPPGTGKSQSITNIIATAVLDGKKVLFVAEKLAALEVVKRRLEREGLGALCLELHSNKSNKRAVIEEIARTWKLGKPAEMNDEALIVSLEQKRQRLNDHVRLLHTPQLPSGLTPFFVLGSLTALGERARDAGMLSFDGAEAWGQQKREEACQMVDDLSSRIRVMGIPSRHPWRGVRRESVLPMDMVSLETAVKAVVERTARLQETVAGLSGLLGLPVPATLKGVEQLRQQAEFILQAPEMDKTALCDQRWGTGLAGLKEILRRGEEYLQAGRELVAQVRPGLWEQDFSLQRLVIIDHGRSLLRFFNPGYLRAMRSVRTYLKISIFAAHPAKIVLIDHAVSGQKAFLALRQSDADGRSAFGSLWHGEKSDWARIRAVMDWVEREVAVGLDSRFHPAFARLETEVVRRWSLELTERVAAFRGELGRLLDWLDLDVAAAFGENDLKEVKLSSWEERGKLWLARLEDLSSWSSYYARSRRACELGLAELVKRMASGEMPAERSGDAFNRIYFGQVLRHMAQQDPQLARFDGLQQDALVKEFRGLDQDRLQLAKYRTLDRHFEGLPPFSAGIGPAGIVKSEMERKRGHRTVRRLLRDAGSVVQAIKPVFMMSPLSVAQFLEPGTVEFDLLVVDEASQVQPVDALGAIARCRQIVVVGDSQQLPPTRFFNRLTSEITEEEEDSSGMAPAKDIESILGLCAARGLPSAMLRWHYRSRHHSLIAVSNHEFYGDSLFIVPSPFLTSDHFGVKFHHIADGVFDSGNSGTNRIEAKAVCRAIIEHARRSPQLSLGVAAFSVRQRQAILDELELLRRECPDTETFFSRHPLEPFFVKNLENVQGDERDVIFVSVGYGKNVHGIMAMRFGPLSNDGGERRLNVLISRAKIRCEVFASITADDIDLTRATGRGVASLKVFLSFAATGRLSIATPSGRLEQSPFEEEVRRAVEGAGYPVQPQVGIAGFFIDLAVLDKDNAGRYWLGIECDGATYHSSRSARDRDRLRQSVLEDHGWIIHRIWSCDWFQRPQEQLRKLVAAIESARSVLAAGSARLAEASTATDAQGPGEPETIARDKQGALGNDHIAVPYRQASFSIPSQKAPQEMTAGEIAGIIFRIVDEEGPVHEDEILVRIRELFGLTRAGARIQDAVAFGVRSVLISRQCQRENGFLTIPGRPVEVRNRENVSSPGLRKPEMLPPCEIQAAVQALINAYHGSTRKEIVGAVARLLGFRVTSNALKSVIETEVGALLSKGELKEVAGMLTVNGE